MKVLVACELSGIVRDAFIAKGHQAISCDLEPTERPGPHYQGNVLDLLLIDDWDLMIAHPPCTYLAASGLHWNRRIEGRQTKTEEALEFARLLLEAPIPKICIENPLGALSRIRKPNQRIQPWDYGHPESKLTCLWLKGLPLLKPTETVLPAIWLEDGTPLWDNTTPSGQNRLSPTKDRAKLRSYTYPGIAQAMADQWGSL